MSNFFFYSFFLQAHNFDGDLELQKLDILRWFGGSFPDLSKRGVCQIVHPSPNESLREFSQKEFGFAFDSFFKFGVARYKTTLDYPAYKIGKRKLFEFFNYSIESGVSNAFVLFESGTTVLSVINGELILNPLNVTEEDSHLFSKPFTWKELPIF